MSALGPKQTSAPALHMSAFGVKRTWLPTQSGHLALLFASTLFFGFFNFGFGGAGIVF
jgi:hypothetical protein